MRTEISAFWNRHPELELLGVVPGEPVTTVYNFMAPDGVRVNVSIDFGRWRHMSFSKRQPPSFLPASMRDVTDEEIGRYLDFFGEAAWFRKRSPIGTGILHLYEAGYPE